MNPVLPIGVSPTYASAGSVHTGTWSGGTIDPDWVGIFGMSTPPIPSLSTGTTTYDFSTLPLGYLPAPLAANVSEPSAAALALMAAVASPGRRGARKQLAALLDEAPAESMKQ